MRRRDFMTLARLGVAGAFLPGTRLLAAEELLEPANAALRRSLADAALTSARRGGASYCDVRIGRYLNQAIQTREDRVLNVTNSESSGVGIRVIVDGAWGFAATHRQTVDGVRETVARALALQESPVRSVQRGGPWRWLSAWLVLAGLTWWLERRRPAPQAQ